MNKQLIASRVDLSMQPVVGRIKAKAQILEAEGVELIYLLRGEPDFDTPVHISKAAQKALRSGETHYPPTRGLSSLRQAIADRMERDFNLAFDPDGEVLITTGATMGIYLALMAIIDPGDEVILFNPVYDPYPVVVSMAGGVPIQVPASHDHGHFSVSEDTLESALTSRTKAILINNPWNPTGTVMKREELNLLTDLAAAYDLIIISDEIYERIVFDSHIHHSIASVSSEARERSIVIQSFSKTYAMTGWRLGYNIAPTRLTEAMHKIAVQFSRSASTFVQYAGVAALSGSQNEADKMVSSYTARREMLIKQLNESGVSNFHSPEGTFFLFMDLKEFGMSSEEMADYLMKSGRVVTVPGSAYGDAGEGFCRISFAYSTESLKRGIEGVISALEDLQ